MTIPNPNPTWLIVKFNLENSSIQGPNETAHRNALARLPPHSSAILRKDRQTDRARDFRKRSHRKPARNDLEALQTVLVK